jgi:Tol biopolymer transport system component
MALVALAVGGCGDGGSGGTVLPEPVPAEISMVGTVASTDSVDAVFPVMVVVKGTDGKPSPGQAVVFTSAGPEGTLGVGTALGIPGFASIVDTTDAAGQIGAKVKLGRTLGEAVLTISVPSLQLQRTVKFQIVPGAPSIVRTTPSDTALYVGGSFTPRVEITDRHGNLRLDPVTYTATTPRASISGGMVTANAVGRGSIVAQVGARSDTIVVSVVPRGTIAAADAEGIVLFDLDGSNQRRLVRGRAYRPHWAPSGDALVFDQDDLATLTRVDMAGNTTSLLPRLYSNVNWPRYSPDGQWIYTGTYVNGRGYFIWRVRPDGTGLEQITPNALHQLKGCPSISADGTTLVYFAHDSFLDVTVRSMDVRTRTESAVTVPGHCPIWSPTSDRILYSGLDGGIRLMTPSMGQPRTLSAPGQTYDYGLDFSPNGAYVVARSTTSGMIEILDATTGETVPLPFTKGLDLRTPTWRPGAN